MKQIKHTDNAETACKKRQDNIAEYIQRIQNKLNTDSWKKDIHWGHAGSLGHVEEQLKEIDEFLG